MFGDVHVVELRLEVLERHVSGLGDRGVGARPISAGLLQPEGGRGMLLVPALRGVASGAITVAVTDEPPGGLSAPTGNTHLIGS